MWLGRDFGIFQTGPGELDNVQQGLCDLAHCAVCVWRWCLWGQELLSNLAVDLGQGWCCWRSSVGVEGGRRWMFRDLGLEESFHFVDCCVWYYNFAGRSNEHPVWWPGSHCCLHVCVRMCVWQRDRVSEYLGVTIGWLLCSFVVCDLVEVFWKCRSSEVLLQAIHWFMSVWQDRTRTNGPKWQQEECSSDLRDSF